MFFLTRKFLIQLLEKYSSLIYCSAAIVPVGDVEQVSSDDWSRGFDVNVRGYALTAKHIAPILKKQGGGSIVNIAGVAGMIGGLLSYSVRGN